MTIKVWLWCDFFTLSTPRFDRLEGPTSYSPSSAHYPHELQPHQQFSVVTKANVFARAT